MFPIQEVDDVFLAFPTNVNHLMPKWEDIPENFRRYKGTKWNDFFCAWFFEGFTKLNLKPRLGVDEKKALRHIRAVMRSFEPKHQHKEAAVAYLMDQWFENAQYETKDGKEGVVYET